MNYHDKILSEAEKIVCAYFDKKLPINNKSEQVNKRLKTAVIILSIALVLSITVSFLK